MAENNLDKVTEFLVKQRMGDETPPASEDPAPIAEDPQETTEEEELVSDDPSAEETSEEEVGEEENQEPSEEEESEDPTSEPEQIEVSDDDLIEVKVDGEVKLATLRELKNAFGGEGAIKQRLDAANEEREGARAARAEIVKEGETAKQAMIAVIQQLDTMLHKPSIPLPDESLKQSNPRAYLQQLDQYQQEAASLEQSRQQLVQAFQHHSQQVEKQMEQQRQAEARLLAENFKPIQSEATRGAAAKDIKDAISHYGFSDEDMKGVIDHRIYMMAYDAMQFHKLTAKGQTQLGELKEKAERKARTLRTKATPRRRKSNQVEKQGRILRDKARQTGKSDDVAAFMLHNRQNRS